MTEELVCSGCGAAIQTEDQNKAGYTPESALEKDIIICQRCFRLRHYNEVQDVELTHQDFSNKLHEIGNQKALIVKVVDIFDLEGSWISGFHRYTGNNDVVLIANKADLLPKSVNQNKVVQWLKKQAKDQGLTAKDVVLISASKNQGVEEAAQLIEKYRQGSDVFITGCTNVGKSTFLNQIIRLFSGEDDVPITTSHFPGTTLDIIEVMLEDGKHLIDTPGIINNRQLIHQMHSSDWKKMMPKKEIKPIIYQLQPGQTLFVGGFARLDFEEGERNSFVAYFANELKIHRTKLENADELMANHLGGMLSPPSPKSVEKLGKWKRYEFIIKKDKTDIVIAGLGWFSVPKKGAKVSIHVPEGTGVSLREAIV
ncbi:hypothetical protein ATL39_2261 [Sinobaca qinghaiensis]|uniref:CP-type G domain-containing protein n=1 Tax=Sinobaca qinghaiensis TaxID=342944 RepID=A0A419V3G8_9BACL|nr:ribosome biogenesis GTPase YqeH [Sinobaca qinghaiensis]RKD73059.1 hypothetical protein ATL39_2261 [Sinobaca qinghaiensis]